ncbi:hypothetical protein Tco_0732863 [Tanacetum coccineum]
MSTMAENVIAAGAEHRPPMLEKSKYNSWQSRMLLYIRVTKEIWDRVKLLIEVTELSLQERESKLYNKFDRFTSEKREAIQSYYLRFAQLINDMNMIEMTMKKIQVNAKFVNNL